VEPNDDNIDLAGEWLILDEWQVTVYLRRSAAPPTSDVGGLIARSLRRIEAAAGQAERRLGSDVRIVVSPRSAPDNA
jgi:hypothetical protein